MTNSLNRKILITKQELNTHYSVYVIDGYGSEHHLGYYDEIPHEGFIHSKAEEIWSNEVKPKEDLLDLAIRDCIKIDKLNNINLNLD